MVSDKELTRRKLASRLRTCATHMGILARLLDSAAPAGWGGAGPEGWDEKRDAPTLMRWIDDDARAVIALMARHAELGRAT